MGTLKYTIVKTKKQYKEYCDKLEELTSKDYESKSDEIELLTLLIENWDAKQNSFDDADPVELIKSLMEANNLKQKDLVEILNLAKGTVSKILNYQKGLSKETIRKLAEYFKVSQEAFNRPYKLVNKQFRNAGLMNTKKKMSGVTA